MGYFAHVTETIVTEVHVLADGVTDDLPFPESEPLGQAFLADLWGDTPQSYVECSIDGAYRGCYPGDGYTWDGTIFAPPAVPEPEPTPEPMPEGRGDLEVPKTVDNTVTLDTVEP